MTSNKLEIFQSDNISVLNKLESNSIDLIYIDPPFNTCLLYTSDAADE